MEIPPRDVDVPLRLLLIEDSPGDARLFRGYLADAGIEAEVSWETSLADGLDAVLREDPDLLVVDMNLPDSEGLETVRSVIAGIGTAPTVVLTGHGDPELGPAAMREGAQDYLEKGKVTPSELRRTIRIALLRARTDREIRRHERRFRALISNVSDVISVIAPDGTVLYHSPSVQRVLGSAPEELEGENVLEYFHPDDRDRVRRERELQQATASLHERVKEQPCLYEISRFLHADERELEECLRDAVARIPAGWQYPSVTSARLRLAGERWSTGAFPEGAPSLVAPITVGDAEAGRIEVCYREERPAEDVAPFIIEEQRLLEAIADPIGVALDRRRTREELEAERQRLAEVFRRAPSWVATLRGPEHVFEMANPAYHELVGDRDESGRPIRDVLPELGCALGQGYLFARPMRPDEVASYLEEESRRGSG